jgi:hypothetical protein
MQLGNYPIDDAEIVGDDGSVSKLAHLVFSMAAGSGLKSAKKVKVIRANKLCHVSTTSTHDKC